MPSVSLWSKTAADNDDADPDISLAEGVEPGLINDDIRAVMAAIAKLYDGTDAFGAIKVGDATAATGALNRQTGDARYGNADWASVASASTTDIGAAASANVLVTGTTTITGFGTAAAGTFRRVRFDGVLTLTHNGTSLILPGAASIITAAGDVGECISAGSGNWRCVSYSPASGQAVYSGAARGHVAGLKLSNNGTDAVNDIDIAAGEARDASNAVTMALASALTKQLDVAWAVGTNQGGLDTGTIANTTYHVWLIQRPDTGVVDALFSTSATAPTMPANYTLKRRIGAVIRAGGTILAFTQDGDRFSLSASVLDVSATNPGTAAVTRTLTTPVGVRVAAIVRVSVTDISQFNSFLITDLSVADEAVTASNMQGSIILNAGGAGAAWQGEVMTNTSSQVRSRISASGANSILSIRSLGWIDRRGRDD